MDANQYRDILAQYMLPTAREQMCPDWVFQQDNDPKHTSSLLMGSRTLRIRGWFADNGVKVLEWPSQSPDLNPIEHLWAHLSRKMKGKRFRNQDDLFNALRAEWENISIDILILCHIVVGPLSSPEAMLPNTN
jgi:hypothetical protein